MRRLLALSVLAFAASAGLAAPSASALACTQLTSDAGVCYQLSDCPRCTPHVIVDPYCADHYQTVWCRTINGVYVDSDKIKVG